MGTKEIARAADFVSFVLLNLNARELSEIVKILFSENKIFFELARKDPRLKEKIYSIVKQFHSSFDVSFELSEISKSLPAFVLYTPYRKKVEKGGTKQLILWESVKPNSKRVLLNKRLFGYVHSGKRYEGLLQKFKGEKLGKGCISVPAQSAAVFLDLFKSAGIPIKTKEVAELE